MIERPASHESRGAVTGLEPGDEVHVRSGSHQRQPGSGRLGGQQHIGRRRGVGQDGPTVQHRPRQVRVVVRLAGPDHPGDAGPRLDLLDDRADVLNVLALNGPVTPASRCVFQIEARVLDGVLDALAPHDVVVGRPHHASRVGRASADDGCFLVDGHLEAGVVSQDGGGQGARSRTHDGQIDVGGVVAGSRPAQLTQESFDGGGRLQRGQHRPHPPPEPSTQDPVHEGTALQRRAGRRRHRWSPRSGHRRPRRGPDRRLCRAPAASRQQAPKVGSELLKGLLGGVTDETTPEVGHSPAQFELGAYIHPGGVIPRARDRQLDGRRRIALSRRLLALGPQDRAPLDRIDLLDAEDPAVLELHRAELHVDQPFAGTVVEDSQQLSPGQTGCHCLQIIHGFEDLVGRAVDQEMVGNQHGLPSSFVVESGRSLLGSV